MAIEHLIGQITNFFNPLQLSQIKKLYHDVKKCTLPSYSSNPSKLSYSSNPSKFGLTKMYILKIIKKYDEFDECDGNDECDGFDIFSIRLLHWLPKHRKLYVLPLLLILLDSLR